MHRELADVWLAVDRDPDVRVAIIRGAGKGVLRGRQLRPPRRIDRRLRGPHARHARGARPRVQRHQLLEADRLRRSTGRRSVPASWSALLADVSVVGPHAPGSSTATRASASPPATTPRSAGRCCAAWPRRSTTCSPARRSRGEEAERIGLVSLCVDDDELLRHRARDRERARRRRAERDPLDEAVAQQLVPHARARSSTRRSATSSTASAAPTRPRASPRCARSATPTSPGRRPSRHAVGARTSNCGYDLMRTRPYSRGAPDGMRAT